MNGTIVVEVDDASKYVDNEHINWQGSRGDLVTVECPDDGHLKAWATKPGNVAVEINGETTTLEDAEILEVRMSNHE